MVGQTLGHYKIVEKLGAGGMGEVYRAEDTTLGREVAIKVLPEAFTSDPERLTRFEREAKLLATLNHPHIAQIHSLEEVDGQKLLVMELVGGQTLAEHIANGPIPLEDSLPTALQIAEALEAAHERGIVHRDLKPANIKLTPEGEVKVLDFGLAKPITDAASGDLTHSPTMTYSPTQAGVLLGTAAYMSPEQARGQEVDRRTDIWAFGVVLWEMLTGERLFGGDTVSDILAAVLRAEPDWDQLPPDAPRAVHRVLRRCLTRDTTERLHDIADARLEIEEAIAAPALVPGVEAGQTRASLRYRRRTGWWIALTSLVIGAVLSSVVWWLREAPQTPQHPPRRLSVTLPAGVSIPAGGDADASVVAISPDGQLLVFVGQVGNTWQLFKRSVDQFEATPIPGTEGADVPFFSPDGRWVGYWDSGNGKLKKVPVAGGTPVVLCDAGDVYGASWGPNDTIVFAMGGFQGILQVSAVGGEPESLLRPSPELGGWDLSYPEFLPDGSAVLFTAWRGLTAASAFVGLLDLDSRETTILVENGNFARYLPSGHLIYGRGDQVEVVPFSLSRRELTGPPVPVPESILYNSLFGIPFLSVSTSGSLAFLPGSGSQLDELVSVDPGGKETPVLDSVRHYLHPRYSPDGESLAVTVFGPEGADIWIVSLSTGVESKLTKGGVHLVPLWTLDGERLAFSRETEEPPVSVSVYWQRADGSTPEEPLLLAQEAGERLWPYAWSADGKLLVYGKASTFSNVSTLEIWLLELDSGETRSLLAEVGTLFAGASVSPDGQWLAYADPSSGRFQVHVQSLPTGGERHQLSTKGGLKPLWSPDGSKLYFLGPSPAGIMVVPVATEPGFNAGSPEVLIERRYVIAPYTSHPNFDISPDGKSFVIVKKSESLGPATEVRVIENWFAELGRLAPTSGN